MPITLIDLTPIGLCLATQDLFDVKRFQQNFCDNLLLRIRDKNLEPDIMKIKRELNSLAEQRKFLEGHKAAIVSNIDKILGLVSSRYSHINFKLAEAIMKEGKELVRKVLLAENFNKIAELEPVFKSKITLPIHELFVESMRREKITMV